MAKREASARRAPVERVIEDLEALKVISDPLRLKILETTSRDPARAWSAKELAAGLGTSQTKLYHHLGLMEEHGFLRVAETRMVSGIQERRYAATAHGFRIERSLLSGGAGQAALSETIDALFDKARGEIIASVHEGLIEASDPEGSKRRASFSMGHARLSEAGVRRVMRLIERLSDATDADEPSGSHYGFLLAFYPRVDGDNGR
jgi:DNA-binding transcriptional ArsR family regulator